MAIIQCPECKKPDVSDKAVTCPNCGYPIQGTPPKAEQWETCHIEWGSKTSFLGVPGKEQYFFAQEESPFQVSCAGSSDFFTPSISRLIGQMFIGFAAGPGAQDHRPAPNDPNSQRAFTQLVTALIEDGWERQDIRGSGWWQHTFRRKFRPEEDGWLIVPFERKWNDYWYFDSEGPG